MADITSNLVGWWTFDESSGSAIDRSGNGNTGTLTGGPPVRQPSTRIGNCLKFNGTSDYVNVPANSSIGSLTSSLTIAAWVMLNSLPADRYSIVDIAESPSDAMGVTFKIRNSGLSTAVLECTTKGVFDYQPSVTGIVTIGAWTHAAVVLDSAFDASFYINGALTELVAQTAAANANTTQAMFIGASANSTTTPTRYFFDGKMDDVRIYGRALSAADIAALYAYTGVFPNSSLVSFPKTKMSASPQGRVI